MLKVLCTAAVVLAVASVSFAATVPAGSIHGNYIEARTADVYTGPCFANGEAEQTGREAVFGLNPAKAVLIVDNRADAEQRLALQSFAKHMGGDLLAKVVKVDYAPIELTIQNGNIHGGAAKLTAGALAEIQTRAMSAADHVCGNEEVWYPPLTKTEHVMPAYALENSYTGDGLGETWHNRFKRSGFVGTFQVPVE